MTVGGDTVVGCTVNPAGTVSTSPPVVTTTSRGPRAAAVSMLRVAVSVVALLTTTGPDVPSAAPPTEILGPKLAVVVPLTQLVYWPLIVTVTVALGVPMLGLIWVMTGVPARTVKPLLSETFSLPVVTSTLRAPTDAFAATVMLAVSIVVLLTVTVLTVTPEPKLTVDVPCVKLVKAPLTTMLAVAPACAELGVAEVRLGRPARTEKPPTCLLYTS